MKRIGFGCMRLHENNKRLVKYAIEHEINYFDVSPYYVNGNCEQIMKEALSGFDRDKFILTSKIYLPFIKTQADLELRLDNSLKQLGVDYLDYLMFQAMDKIAFNKMIQLEATSFLDKMIQKGKIKKSAFSFHDDYFTFVNILDAFTWDMCQVQMNYLDICYQDGMKGIQYANNHNIPVFVMGPLKGGVLTSYFGSDRKNMDYLAKLAYKWTLSHASIALVIGGFHSTNQIDNICNLDGEESNLTAEDQNMIETIQRIYKERSVTHCTNCRYCGMMTSCTIPIYDFLYGFDMALFTDNYGEYYNKYFSSGVFSSILKKCIKCKHCMTICPQHIDILSMFEYIDKFARVYEKRKWRNG